MLILRDEMLLLLLAERKRETCEHVRYLLCFRLVVEEKEKKNFFFFSVWPGEWGGGLIECPNSMCEHVRACVMSRSSALCRHFVDGAVWNVMTRNSFVQVINTQRTSKKICYCCFFFLRLFFFPKISSLCTSQSACACWSRFETNSQSNSEVFKRNKKHLFHEICGGKKEKNLFCARWQRLAAYVGQSTHSYY